MQRASILVAAAAMVAACGGGGGQSTVTSHSYHAAASVGDFLTITIDHSAETISYDNITNGDSGTVAYTPRSDGGIDVPDPNGDILQCYEMPGVAVVCQGTNLGPTSADTALVYGILDTPLTVADLGDLDAGFLVFRTKEGGIEVGQVSFDGSSNGAGTSYFPVDQVLPPGFYGKTLFDDISMSSTKMSDDQSLGCVEMTPDGDTDPSYLFGTAGGNFMVDSPNGAIFAFREAASKDFLPAHAGTYSALVYNKRVSYLAGVESTEDLHVGTATVTVGTSGAITVTQDSQTVLSSTLLPFEGSDWQGPGKVVDPVHGLFYVLNADDQLGSYAVPPVFITFFEDAMAFAEFRPVSTGDFGADPQVPAHYEYTYGIAVRAP
ncbi:MAG TPA: hypothetical protein VFG59_00435 [Anaeromyxobacter sp.]|nr:hypothetical protein [Anaeromyxobacter sp.]